MGRRRKQMVLTIYQEYDLTVKSLLAHRSKDIAEYLGVDSDSIEVVNVELPTVRRMVDHAWRVKAPAEHLVLVEFQSSYEPDLLERLNVYVALLTERHKVPVRPILILLREQADSPLWTGEWSSGLPGEPATQVMRYEKRCIAREPYEKFLQGRLGVLPFAPVATSAASAAGSRARGGLGVLPYAPVAAGAKKQAAWVTEAVLRRIEKEAPPEQAEKLALATYFLMGLQYEEHEVRKIFRGIRWMKDSVTYQGLIREGLEKGRILGRQEGWTEGRAEGKAEGRAEGKAEGLREAILDLGTKFWGKPKPNVRKAITAIDEEYRLKQLLQRIPEAKSWKELLD